MRSRLSVVAAIAVTMCMGATGVASASAHEFITNKTKAALKTEKVKVQKFIAHSLPVECKTATVLKGETTALTAPAQEATIEYGECLVSGTNAVKNITAEYTFLASEEVTVKKPITIETVTAGLCTITVKAQTVGKEGNATNKLKYNNVTDLAGGKAIELEPIITGIESTGKGSLTNCEYSTPDKAGTYKGTSVVFIEGASNNLEWK